jgi:hypothetical protein
MYLLPSSTGAACCLSVLTFFLALFGPWLDWWKLFLSFHRTAGSWLICHQWQQRRTGGQFSPIWNLLQPWCLRQACAWSGDISCNCRFPMPHWTIPLDCIVRCTSCDAPKQNKSFGECSTCTTVAVYWCGVSVKQICWLWPLAASCHALTRHWGGTMEVVCLPDRRLIWCMHAWVRWAKIGCWARANSCYVRWCFGVANVMRA